MRFIWHWYYILQCLLSNSTWMMTAKSLALAHQSRTLFSFPFRLSKRRPTLEPTRKGPLLDHSWVPRCLPFHLQFELLLSPKERICLVKHVLNPKHPLRNPESESQKNTRCQPSYRRKQPVPVGFLSDISPLQVVSSQLTLPKTESSPKKATKTESEERNSPPPPCPRRILLGVDGIWSHLGVLYTLMAKFCLASNQTQGSMKRQAMPFGHIWPILFP